MATSLNIILFTILFTILFARRAYDIVDTGYILNEYLVEVMEKYISNSGLLL